MSNISTTSIRSVKRLQMVKAPLGVAHLQMWTQVAFRSSANTDDINLIWVKPIGSRVGYCKVNIMNTVFFQLRAKDQTAIYTLQEVIDLC